MPDYHYLLHMDFFFAVTPFRSDWVYFLFRGLCSEHF